MAIQIILLIAGFILLIKGASWFVDSASGIAVRAGIPQLVIGLTIVAMGTSLPEAAVSISSTVKGYAGIAVGNVVGSNILNILLILGITAVLTPLAVRKSTMRFEIPFMTAVSVLLSVCGLADNRLGRTEGVLLVVLFLCYLGYLAYMSRTDIETVDDDTVSPAEQKPVYKLLFILAAGIACTVLGSSITVDAATEIAEAIGISDRVIGLTVVAFGTSLPELVTCIIAAARKNADIAVGNIVGSNIFNILFILGSCACISPLDYSRDFLLDSIMCTASAVLLLLLILNRDRKLSRWGGAVMLAVYAGYFISMVL